MSGTPQPPEAPRHPVVRDLHGVRVVDDYAWMHGPDGVPGGPLRQYLAAERAHYARVTDRLEPARARLRAAIAGRMPVEDVGVAWRQGGARYRMRTPPGADYPSLCRLEPDGTERVLLDVQREAAGHDHAELGVLLPSPDGSRLAWSLDTTGDENYPLRVRDLRTGRDLPDVIPRSYETAAWSSDSGTLFYVVQDRLNRPAAVRRHLVDDDPRADAEIYRDDDEAFDVTVRGTRSGALVVILSRSHSCAECHLVPAGEPATAPVLVRRRRPGVLYDVEHVAGPAGGTLLMVTDDGAPEFRVLAGSVPSGGPEPDPVGTAGWRELVPGRDDVRVYGVEAFRDHLVLPVRVGARTALEVRDRAGALLGTLHAPVPEGTLQLDRNQEYDTSTVTLTAQSLVQPPVWWDVDLAGGPGAPWRERHRHTAPGYRADDYVTERVDATAADGTGVPVTVARRRDTPVDGRAPCLVYGYGSYESCVDPEFEPGVSVLLDAGAVFAIAHVRGGGEGGRRWWLAARTRGKPVSFDDLAAAGRGLIASGHAAPDRVALRGLSAGGLLAAAGYGRDPMLWRAVVAEVPFVDVVGSMLDPRIPLTVQEWEVWGDPRDPDDFAVMRGYSPYENPPAGRRPDLLVTGSLHDTRVLVHEPAKWVARLRATATRPAELLFRAELGEGAHAGPAGRYARAGYEAEILAWVLDRIGAGDGGPAGGDGGGDAPGAGVAARP